MYDTGKQPQDTIGGPTLDEEDDKEVYKNDKKSADKNDIHDIEEKANEQRANVKSKSEKQKTVKELKLENENLKLQTQLLDMQSKMAQKEVLANQQSSSAAAAAASHAPSAPPKKVEGKGFEKHTHDTLFIENENFFKTRLCLDFVHKTFCKRGIMCWYAHGQSELRQKDQSLDKYMNEVILPKYPRIKTWKVVNAKPGGAQHQPQPQQRADSKDEFEVVEARRGRGRGARGGRAWGDNEDWKASGGATHDKKERFGEDSYWKKNGEEAVEKYEKYFVLTVKFNQPGIENQKHIVYGSTTVEEVLEMIRENNSACNRKISLRFKNQLMNNPKASLVSQGMYRDSFVIAIMQ